VDRRAVRVDHARLLPGRARLKEQDADGVDAEVLFGSSRPMGLFLRHKDPDFHLAGFRAYNDWLLKDFCTADRAG